MGTAPATAITGERPTPQAPKTISGTPKLQRCSWLLLWLGCVWACDDHTALPDSRPTPAPSSSASATPSTRVAEKPKAPPAPCRALRVSGSVAFSDGQQLLESGALDGKRWLRLPARAQVAVRHATTSREYLLLGPALVLPCRAGAEEVLLAEGTLKASAGSATRPGATVSVATPLGWVRYGDAALQIRTTSRSSEVAVSAGNAWLEPSAGSRRVGKATLAGPKASSRLVPTATYSANGVLDACEAHAAAAARSAVALLQTPPKQGIGAAAAEQMQLRVTARQACRVAEAALELAPQPAGIGDLRSRLAVANERWQRIPARRTAEQK